MRRGPIRIPVSPTKPESGDYQADCSQVCGGGTVSVRRLMHTSYNMPLPLSRTSALTATYTPIENMSSSTMDTGGRDELDRTVAIDDPRLDPTGSRSGVTGNGDPRVDKVVEVEKDEVREAIIVTPEMTFRTAEVDVERVAYATRSRSLTTIKRVNQAYQTRLKIVKTGGYIQLSSGRLLGGVLGSLNDGLLYMQQFTMTRQSSPRETPEYLFCCRIFIEQDGRYWFLSYITNADNRATVQFQPFRKDQITEENLDGRCFIRRTMGNSSIFGSLFDNNMYMCYDKRSRNLRMKRIKSLSRLRGEFLFSEVTFGTQDRTRRSLPDKLLTGLRSRLQCLGFTDNRDASDALDAVDGQCVEINGQLDAKNGQLNAINGQLDANDGQFVALDGKLDAINGQSKCM